MCGEENVDHRGKKEEEAGKTCTVVRFIICTLAEYY
jgi:hypothetical protein